jgi:hypothetical protein
MGKCVMVDFTKGKKTEKKVETKANAKELKLPNGKDSMDFRKKK